MSLHALSAPTFQRMLGSLLIWLDKAEAHAKARGFPPDNYLALRLAPDMLPFVKQIQIASDAAKGCMSRLAGIEVPQWPDTEATLDDCRARIRRTIDYVAGFDAARLEGSEAREVLVPRRSGEPLRFTGADYLRHWALPNFFFHVTTAYALLRHAGVEIGKSDYLGS